MSSPWKQWEGLVVNGDFHLRQYLGGSEQSAVFLTEYGRGKPRQAAIKLVPVGPGEAELQLSRWRLGSKLSHPHVIRIFDVGRCQLEGLDLAFVVMEYAEENLAQVLLDRSLTPAEMRVTLAPILNALAFLHGQNFVHGHLKPANLLAVNDQLKLSIDGLYPMGESRAGAPSVYDPPERASGSITPAGDVWSLAVTMVEALTQQRPAWDGTGWRSAPPKNLPSPFSEIARHCLVPEPQRRWTLAEIKAFANQTSTLPTQAPPSSIRPPARRRYAILAAAAGLAIVAVIAGPRILHRNPQVEPASSTTLPLEGQSKPQQTAPPVARGQASAASGGELQGSGNTVAKPSATRSAERATSKSRGDARDEVVQQVIPDVSPRARDTIEGTIRVAVRVSVGASGSVVGAELDRPGPSKYFARQAMQAARGWKFTPAGADQQDNLRKWILRFEFRRTGTRAHAARVSS